MAKKKQKQTAASSRAPSIFTIIGYLTSNKKPWEDLTEEEQKKAGVYMLNRWFSMDRNLLPIVNAIQEYMTGRISPMAAYRLYYSLLPSERFYLKYIKAKGSQNQNKELISLVCSHLTCSEREAIDNIATLSRTKSGRADIETLMRQYGFEDKKIKAILKTINGK